MWFCAWALTGALLALGVLALLTIGLPMLLLAALLAWALARRPAARAGLPGLLSGAGAPFAYVAWLNRDGPGHVCHAIPGGETCTEQWSPVPFVVVAAFLVLAGLALFAVRDRRPGRPAGS